MVGCEVRGVRRKGVGVESGVRGKAVRVESGVEYLGGSGGLDRVAHGAVMWSMVSNEGGDLVGRAAM